VDLFTPQIASDGGFQIDPCAGPAPLAENPFATAENCGRTGVTAAQYGHVAENPIGYVSLKGGNPDLKPESSDSITAGVILTPRFAPGLSLSADAFDIRVSGALEQIGADLTIEQCLETDDPFYCRLVHRAAGTGSLWLGGGYVSDITQNASLLHVRGVDLQIGYTLRLPRAAGRELGDLLLTLTSVARHLDIQAEMALRDAVGRLARRVGYVEGAARAAGRALEAMDASERDRLWDAAKLATDPPAAPKAPGV